MMKTNALLTRLSCALLASCAIAGAVPVEYYVAPNGSDANPGSLASPFATIAQA